MLPQTFVTLEVTPAARARGRFAFNGFAFGDLAFGDLAFGRIAFGSSEFGHESSGSLSIYHESRFVGTPARARLLDTPGGSTHLTFGR